MLRVEGHDVSEAVRVADRHLHGPGGGGPGGWAEAECKDRGRPGNDRPIVRSSGSCRVRSAPGRDPRCDPGVCADQGRCRAHRSRLPLCARRGKCRERAARPRAPTPRSWDGPRHGPPPAHVDCETGAAWSRRRRRTPRADRTARPAPAIIVTNDAETAYSHSPLSSSGLILAMNTDPVSTSARSPAFAADSIRSTDVSLCPLTVLAKEGVDVMVGTQAPLEMPSALQKTRKG